MINRGPNSLLHTHTQKERKILRFHDPTLSTFSKVIESMENKLSEEFRLRKVNFQNG